MVDGEWGSCGWCEGCSGGKALDEIGERERDGWWGVDMPLKTVSTVTKYEPMGITIMPRVKARSFMMTELETAVSGMR